MQQVEQIGEEEVLVQSFQMDNPNTPDDEIPVEQFNDDRFNIARATLNYTDHVDQQLGVVVLDDGAARVSRDVLATYKTLIYRQAEDTARTVSMWRQIAIVSLVGAGAVLAGYWF